MAGNNNFWVGILKFLSLATSIHVFKCGMRLIGTSIVNCDVFLPSPSLVVALLFVVYPFIHYFFKRSTNRIVLHIFYLAIAFTYYLWVTSYIIGNARVGEALPGKSYSLNNYKHLLQNKERNWNKISRCLRKHKICESLNVNGNETTREEFFRTRLSSLQSGCCKPSNDCKFEYVTPTQWIRTKNSSFTNPDCNKWSNDQKTLCYSCDSCKAGLLAKVKLDFFSVEIDSFLLFVLFFFLVLIQVYPGIINNANNANNVDQREHPNQLEEQQLREE